MFILLFIQRSICQCVPGTDIGAFLVSIPNRTSIVIVGNQFEIKWKYSVLVQSYPTAIDISLQNMELSNHDKFPIKTVINATVGQPLEVQDEIGFNWIVPSLNDGQYQMRIGMAGRDPLLYQNACLQNGEAYGGSSSVFKVSNPKRPTQISPSKYGPGTIPSSSSRFQSQIKLVALLFL